MKLLTDTLQKLPINLQHLSLDLYQNNLGLKPLNLKGLWDSFKILSNLKHLELELTKNNLG